jgi:hypothetical protein
MDEPVWSVDGRRVAAGDVLEAALRAARGLRELI